MIASVIEELDCTDRCVEYSIDDTAQSYDRIVAWVNDAIIAGERIRYAVDPDHLGLVRVDFTRAGHSERE